jgi:hypothetical protein
MTHSSILLANPYDCVTEDVEIFIIEQGQMLKDKFAVRITQGLVLTFNSHYAYSL